MLRETGRRVRGLQLGANQEQIRPLAQQVETQIQLALTNLKIERFLQHQNSILLTLRRGPYLILSYLILSYLILSYLILSYLIIKFMLLSFRENALRKYVRKFPYPNIQKLYTGDP